MLEVEGLSVSGVMQAPLKTPKAKKPKKPRKPRSRSGGNATKTGGAQAAAAAQTGDGRGKSSPSRGRRSKPAS